MNVQTTIFSPNLMELDGIAVTLQGLASDRASVVVSLHGHGQFRQVFAGSTVEIRRFAAELMRHADVTDAAMAEQAKGGDA